MVEESKDFFYSQDSIDFASCFTKLSCKFCDITIGKCYKTTNKRVESLRYIISLIKVIFSHLM